jgi:penicillin amidase
LAAERPTIYRDTYGVPHIYGKTDADVVFGLMYAQAEDNFWQIEDSYIRSLGRSAELHGPTALLGDVLLRAFEVNRMAQAEYKQSPPEIRAICDAFAAGLNEYLAKHPEVKPRLLTRFEPWHILASQRGGAAGAAGPAQTGASVAEMLQAFPGIGADAVPLRQQPGGEAEDLDEGSNMWAAAPRKSASRRALLFMNPHVGFFGGGQRYEAHLESKQGLRITGFAILGTPYIRSGFNDRHGWSHTNNYADTSDVYREVFDDPARPLAYRYGAGYRLAVEWSEEVPVKTAAGIETRRVTFRKTHHGPIVAITGNGALAARAARAGINVRGGEIGQRLAMAKARNLREFRAALSRRVLTGSNTIYADRHGEIFYLHGNAVPRRNPRFDWTKPVDGSDPETEWQGYHSMDELPQSANPASGYLQNCNSTPYRMDGSEGQGSHPKYMVSEQDNLRAQMSRRLLEARERFTFEEWTRAATDTRVLKADTAIPELLALWEKQPAAGLEEVVAELKTWNRVSTTDSAAMTIFARWQRQDPPDLAALKRVKESLEEDFGTWRVPWGQVNRLQRVHTSGTLEPFADAKPSLPVAGAPGSAMGIIFNFTTRRAPGQKRAYGVSGNTYVAVVEFGRKLQARSIVTFGQSAQEGSPHFFDQAPIYARGEFKPVWFYKKDVEAHTERKYRPGEEGK